MLPSVGATGPVSAADPKIFMAVATQEIFLPHMDMVGFVQGRCTENML